MFDVSCMNAPSNICDFFTKANSKHKHETRFSSSGNYYVQTSRLNLNQDSFSRFGAKRWNAIPNEFRQLSEGAFKKKFTTFCSGWWRQRTITLKRPFSYKKWQILRPRLNALIIDRFC